MKILSGIIGIAGLPVIIYFAICLVQNIINNVGIQQCAGNLFMLIFFLLNTANAFYHSDLEGECK